MCRQLITLLVLLTSLPVAAQWIGMKNPALPRDADGKFDRNAVVPVGLDGRPDLSGVWFARDARGSLYDLEKIRPWAREAMDINQANFYMDEPRFSCLPSGPAALVSGMVVGGLRRFVQHPEYMAILDSEMNYRQVYLDGRKLEEEPMISTWQGYSIGYWDGDTLVIESNGFNDKTWLTREGLPHTDQLQTVERYTRVSFGQINLEVAYDDPGTFFEPVGASVKLVHAGEMGIMEQACNESRTGQSHHNGEISQSDNKVVEIPEEVLQSYVGAYEGVWLGQTVRVEFVIEDGETWLIRTPSYSYSRASDEPVKYRAIAQSENAFDCTCGLGFVFNKNDQGAVDEVLEVHVSGGWAFKRVN